MRLSQLTRRMDRGDEIRVCLFGAPIGREKLYCGAVRGIRKEDCMNAMSVCRVYACGGTVIVEVKAREGCSQKAMVDMPKGFV